MSAGGFSRMRSRVCVAMCSGVVAFVFTTTVGVGSAGAAEPTFNAHGSVEQVYVTDLSPGEQVSLLNSAGTTIATRQANSNLDRVLRLRLRRPGGPSERHLDPGQPDGLHGGRREHARHRLFGRRV